MSVKIVKTGGHTKSNANRERGVHCHQNVAPKSFEPQTIPQISPQLTDESEFPSLNELSNKVCVNPQLSGRKYSDKLKLHSNQNTAPNYFRFQQEPIKKDLNERNNQSLSSPQLKNKWLQDTNRIKFNERPRNQTNKQNEPDKPDFISRRALNSSLCNHRFQGDHSLKDSPFAKSECKNQPQRQKLVVNKSDCNPHSSVESSTAHSHVANLPTKSNHQVQSSKNEIKLILGKNSAKEVGKDSSDASKKKKKRKSKVKRQIALQTGKITVLTPEVHSKILNRTSELTTQNFKAILTDINDEEEYPELGKSTIPTLQKENYPKKEVNSLELISEDSKKIVKGEQKIEISEDKNLVIKDVTKESGLLSLTISDDKSVIEKKGKDSKPVHPNDPITVSFFDILVNKNNKTKVKDLKTEVDPHLSIGLMIKTKTKKNSIHPLNLLDSSSPAVKRGKEREKPKPKKPSQLKKIILMDRKTRREQLLLLKSNNLELENPAMGIESELFVKEPKNNEIYCTDILASIEDQSETSLPNLLENQSEILEEENSYLVSCDDAVLQEDLDDLKVSNILPTDETEFNVSNVESVEETCDPVDASGTSNPSSDVDKCIEAEHISGKTSALSADVESVNYSNDSTEYVPNAAPSLEIQLNIHQSPDNLSVNFETNLEQIDSADKGKAVKILLHTRNFREYCNHLISKDIDDVVYALLDDLARFQDRLHQKDPIKARMKRRMIYGVKEVKKHVKLRKLRCIIVAADIENIETHGGLNDLLNDIKSSAADHHIPCIFALSRKSLGKVCRKPVPVSCVGVFNYEGSEANFKKMIELQAQSKIDYAEISTKLSDSITDEQILSLLKAKREAPETLRAIRTTILGDFFLENKTKVVEPDKASVANDERDSGIGDREA